MDMFILGRKIDFGEKIEESALCVMALITIEIMPINGNNLRMSARKRTQEKLHFLNLKILHIEMH